MQFQRLLPFLPGKHRGVLHPRPLAVVHQRDPGPVGCRGYRGERRGTPGRGRVRWETESMLH